MDSRKPLSEHPDDLAGLPEELLRHSLLLFAREDETAATEVDQPAPAADDAVEQSQAAEASTETAATSDLSAERAGPTYHQLVKRELADYLRKRSAMADHHRENLRRQGAVKPQRTPTPRALPVVTPEKSPFTIAVDAAPRTAETMAGRADSLHTGSGIPSRPAPRALTQHQSPPANPSQFRVKAPRNPPESMNIATRPAKDRFGVTTVKQGSVPGSDRQLHLQFNQPEAETAWGQPLIRPAAPAKPAPATTQREIRGQSGFGKLTLGVLTIEGQKMRSSLSIDIEPLAALQL